MTIQIRVSRSRLEHNQEGGDKKSPPFCISVSENETVWGNGVLIEGTAVCISNDGIAWIEVMRGTVRIELENGDIHVRNT